MARFKFDATLSFSFLKLIIRMPCDMCIGYVQDALTQAPKLNSRFWSLYKRKRLIKCIEPISYLLTRHIEEARPDLYEWLNTMEMINCAVLRQDATREYRLYQILSYQQPVIDEIIMYLMEQCILTKTHDKYEYEEWFAEKVIFLCGTIKHIHNEHTEGLHRRLATKKSLLTIRIPPTEDDLYV